MVLGAGTESDLDAVETPESAGWSPIVKLTLLVIVTVVLAAALIEPRELISDEAQNLTNAYNIATHQVSSTELSDSGKPAADMRREPIYPFLMSLVLRPGEPSISCLLDNSPETGCQARHIAIRSINVLFLAALVVATYASARSLLRTSWALATAAAVGLSPALLQYSNDLLTEPLAALLLLLGSYSLSRAATEETEAWKWSFATGVCFGLLVLVKAIFLFAIPIVAVIVAIRRSDLQRSFVAATVVFGTVVVIVAPWSIRNLVMFDDPLPSSGSPQVLAVRAESMDMTATEYVSSFVYETGIVGPRIASLLFDESDYVRHDRKNPESFWRRVFPEDGGFAAYERDADTAGAILDRPFKFAALTLPFAWRGAFGATPIGSQVPSWWWHPFGSAWTAYALLGVVFRWMSFLALFWLVLVRRDDPRLFFLLLPASVLFGLYALTSHFIPRYGHPMLPIGYIALAVVAQSMWDRVRSRRPSPLISPPLEEATS